jgi:nitroimidazol reductase NimA-like FMN-containing flavoprotein (pyridoxamine 5'-phosphate oxidase superfamily)
MEEKAIGILDQNRTMAISTVRLDGWPQTTIVGYANDGVFIYFVIFRASQKFSNIGHDNRISLAVGNEPTDIRLTQAVFAGAIASEVTDPSDRDRAWRLLVKRHPNLIGAPQPDWSSVALMRAECLHLSVLDYTMGLGHADALHLPPKTEHA